MTSGRGRRHVVACETLGFDPERVLGPRRLRLSLFHCESPAHAGWRSVFKDAPEANTHESRKSYTVWPVLLMEVYGRAPQGLGERLATRVLGFAS
jgi:hypothetical protein